MPKVSDIPKVLRPFQSLGVVLSPPSLGGGDHATGDCPFCGREGKFSVSLASGQWDCKVCAESGNTVGFLRKVYEESDNGCEAKGVVRGAAFRSLAAERGLLYPQTLAYWGVRQSLLTAEWLLPGCGTGGKIDQIYRYVPSLDVKHRGTAKHITLCGPEYIGTGGEPVGHALFGPVLTGFYDPTRPDVYICEGTWDGMALWEALLAGKRSNSPTDKNRIVISKGGKGCMLARANVLAVPGSAVFLPQWASLLSGKRVFLLYDSDRPRTHPRTGKEMPPAGLAGMRRVAHMLANPTGGVGPPKSINYLHWGDRGFDPDMPDGYDVRDCLRAGVTVSGRLAQLDTLLSRLAPIPKEWTAPPSYSSQRMSGGGQLISAQCEKWSEVEAAWRDAMPWTSGLQAALTVMLATVTSTPFVGDQLWVKIVGPPSTGKSTLCEAVCVNKKYAYLSSITRGFHSGYKTDKDGKEDHSLVAKLAGLTLVTKDGDALVQSPNLGQILAEGRDLYDGAYQTDYRNAISRGGSGHRMTWILCGTSALRVIDASELGERFLTCSILDYIEEELERRISLSAAQRSFANLSIESNGQLRGQYSPKIFRAMQLTGGYIDYLRASPVKLVSQVRMSAQVMEAITEYGRFVAYMRARPSKNPEMAERELSARLSSQMVRLARCLAAVLQRDHVDSTVLATVHKVALDTSRGRSLEVAGYLAKVPEGLATKAISTLLGETDDKCRVLLKFMRQIRLIELHTPSHSRHVVSHPKWILTPSVAKLYTKVVGGPAQEHGIL
jgi:hypothetical protein